jgi:ferrous iron transport protein A
VYAGIVVEKTQMQLTGVMDTLKAVDSRPIPEDIVLTMQSSFKRGPSKPHPGNLTELKRGESAILESIDLDEYEARRLMELGFLPGQRVTAAQAAPGGDPRVFQVDGSEVALRRETARHLLLKKAHS